LLPAVRALAELVTLRRHLLAGAELAGARLATPQQGPVGVHGTVFGDRVTHGAAVGQLCWDPAGPTQAGSDDGNDDNATLVRQESYVSQTQPAPGAAPYVPLGLNGPAQVGGNTDGSLTLAGDDEDYDDDVTMVRQNSYADQTQQPAQGAGTFVPLGLDGPAQVGGNTDEELYGAASLPMWGLTQTGGTDDNDNDDNAALVYRNLHGAPPQRPGTRAAKFAHVGLHGPTQLDGVEDDGDDGAPDATDGTGDKSPAAKRLYT